MTRSLFTAAFLFLSVASPLFACSCVGQGPLSYQDYEFSEYIFIGKIEKVTTVTTTGDFPLAKTSIAVFRPYKLYKGETDSAGTITISSDVAGTCGINFREGQIMFIFSNGWLNTCSRYERITPEKGQNERKAVDAYISESNWDKQLEEFKKLPRDGMVNTYFYQGKMAGGKKVGRWDYYDPARYFAAVNEKDTAGKRRELSSTCYYTAGELDSAWFYQGTWTYFNRYKNGRQFGWQESYRDGKKDYFDYIDNNGRRTHYYQWVGSGIMFAEMHDDSNGYVHNLYYEDDGKLQSSTKMRNDSVYEETAYRHDGSIIMIGTLKEEYVSYYTRTFFYIEDYWNIKGEHVVTNGTGHLVEWHNDSVKALEVDVKNGILYGAYREWYSDGQLSKEAFYYPPGDHDTYGNTIEPFTSNYYSRYGVPYSTRRVWSGSKLYYEETYKPDGSVHRISYDKEGKIDYESDDKVNWMWR